MDTAWRTAHTGPWPTPKLGELSVKSYDDWYLHVVRKWVLLIDNHSMAHHSYWTMANSRIEIKLFLIRWWFGWLHAWHAACIRPTKNIWRMEGCWALQRCLTTSQREFTKLKGTEQTVQRPKDAQSMQEHCIDDAVQGLKNLPGCVDLCHCGLPEDHHSESCYALNTGSMMRVS